MCAGLPDLIEEWNDFSMKKALAVLLTIALLAAMFCQSAYAANDLMVEHDETVVISHGGTYTYLMKSNATNAISIETEEPVIINNSEITGYYGIVTKVPKYNLTVKNTKITAIRTIANNVDSSGGVLSVENCELYSEAAQPQSVIQSGSSAVYLRGIVDTVVKDTYIQGFVNAVNEVKSNSDGDTEHSLTLDNVETYSYYAIATTVSNGHYSVNNCRINLVDRSSANVAFYLKGDKIGLTAVNTSITAKNYNNSLSAQSSVVYSTSNKNVVTLSGTSSVTTEKNTVKLIDSKSTGLSKVSIEGGSYFGVSVSATSKIPASAISVTGGNFSSDISSFAPSGRFLIAQDDGTYKVSGIDDEKMLLTDSSPLKMGFSETGNLETLGYQKKATGKLKGNNVDTQGLRLVTVVNSGLIKSANIKDYGYVVAKYEGDKAIGDLKFGGLRPWSYNGEKVISCKNSTNTFANDFGLYSADTKYKYITLAVNGMDDGDRIVARFYIQTTDGKYYFSKYSTYDGILAEY